MGSDCRQNDEALSRLIDDDLEAGDRDRIEAHLSHCGRCSEVLRQLDEIRARVRSLPFEKPPADLRIQIGSALDRELGASRRSRRWTVLALAASLVLAGGIGWLALRGLEAGPAIEVVREAGGAAQVAKLMEGLKHPDADVCAAAAESLGILGPAARDAVPALEALLQDSRPKVREAARAALQKIR